MIGFLHICLHKNMRRWKVEGLKTNVTYFKMLHAVCLMAREMGPRCRNVVVSSFPQLLLLVESIKVMTNQDQKCRREQRFLLKEPFSANCNC